MANTISNQDNVIDSRNIIERIEELESELEEVYNNMSGYEETTITFTDWVELSTLEECQELKTLKALAEECEQYADDWQYGETLIHRDYFEEYMDEMAEECYELPKDLPYWMNITLDYVALEQDYTSVDFDGQEFLIRSV